MELIEDAAGVRGREVIPRVLPITSPAAGADWSVAVPGGVMWYVQSVTAKLTTSAVVANRSFRLSISDGSISVFQVVSAQATAATQGRTYHAIKGLSGNVVDPAFGAVNIGFPNVPLLAGWSIATITTNIDVADQWSNIIFYVFEVIETPYDVELARDNAALRGMTSSAYPQIRIGE